MTAPGDISLFEMLSPLVRRWRLVAATALGCAALTAVVLLLQRPIYTAETNFTPETPGNSSVAGSIAGLAGLAGQLGLGSASGTSVSPDFFAELIHSREVLRSTLTTEFSDPAARDKKRTLLELMDVRGGSSEERLQKGSRRLAAQSDASVEKTTGIVTLQVEMPDAQLAADVANRMIALLNQFNLERRQSQSHEQRRFTGDRLRDAEAELREAERAQLRFLQANRQYIGSPLLEFQAAQHERTVQVKQEVFLTLTKAHEEARIAEVRDTPVLTVIDPAVPPAMRSRPKRVLGVAVALIIGGLFGIALAYIGAFRSRVRRDSTPDYVDFQAAWDEARGRSRRTS
ncbi:MAG TPA: Wzz/FepE/Etk N-terminal domain-containing protein [Gemmatimonadales bacterium]|nr:Wzz/FepE/Etk N-terminal domain-containing protein [Gemmatimonadales bacterium]